MGGPERRGAAGVEHKGGGVMIGTTKEIELS
jgi:hypothetical protein